MAMHDDGARVADAPPDNWVDRWAPRGSRPYLRMMRADRPIGWWLLLLPGWQSIVLAIVAAGGFTALDAAASPGWAWALWLILAFFIGAIVMRGAGCVLNDIVDRDIDAKVARTRSRPIPSGQVSVGAAVALLAASCLLGLAILLTFDRPAILLGLASALPVAIYPFMKRVTWWPQAFLGVAFSWGALLGWTAFTGALGWPALLLYLGGVCWTIGYDTIYAHQDREDDALIGVRSTARLFGAATKPAMTGFYLLAVAFAGAAGAAAGAGALFYLGLTAYAAHLGWQILRLDIDDPEVCLALFKSNRDAGLLLVGAFALGAA